MNISMERRYIPLAILAAGIFVSVIIWERASAQTGAQTVDTIAYPIAELGNCGSKSECKTYCDEPGNLDACISFAEKNDLMPPEEIAMAKKFIAAGSKGPGGCTGKDSCEAYCNEMANIDECVAFAEKSGMMPPEELEEAKKVQAAIKRGVKPPPCGGKAACDAYCEDPNHIEECVAFASEAGFMSPEEQANAQKMVQAIKSGVKPLPCRGKQACDDYCGQEEHISECIEFATAAGFMSSDEAEMARKTGGRGPGGCRGKEECDAFCTSSPENEAVCMQFKVDKGLISPQEQKEMEEGDNRFRESFSGASPDVIACLQTAFGGSDNFEKLKTGAIRPTRDIGEKMSVCFREQEERRIREEMNGGPEGGRGGPGGERGFGPRDGGNFPSLGPGFDEHRGEFQDGPPTYDEGRPPCEGEECSSYGPPPGSGDYRQMPPQEGEEQAGEQYRLFGDIARPEYIPLTEDSGRAGAEFAAPPPLGSQPQGEQIGQIQQGEMRTFQQFVPPSGTESYPPPEGTAPAGTATEPPPPPPPSDGGTAPVAPAPAVEPAPAQAPASEPISAKSPSAMVASVVNFFLSPLFVRDR